MVKIFTCSFCGDPIIRDRYNIYFVLERQDNPGKSGWQKSTDSTKENVCPKCQRLITNNHDNFCYILKANKGIIPKDML